MANFLPMETVTAIIQEFAAGESLRRIAAKFGIAKNTALRYKQFSSVPDKCPCGERYGHRGWCSVRFKQSPARQALMARLAPKLTNPHALRPGAFFLGLLWGTSSLRSNLPINRRCSFKACVRPASFFENDEHLCRYHVNFFYYGMSLTGDGVGWDETHDSENGSQSPMSIIEPWDNSFVFEYRGKRTREATKFEEVSG